MFWVFTLTIVLGSAYGIFNFIQENESKKITLTSPIPDLLYAVFSKSASASDFWQPNISGQKPSNLTLSAKAAISYDTSTNSLLYAKEIDKKLPMASLTKIMTAIIALENIDLNSEVTVSDKAASIGEGTMGLSKGESLTIEELLYGLLLQSGNDAGETIAESSPFGRDGFMHLMNKKAEEMGLSNTRFTNPTGLQGDGAQYSTVKELVALTRYAMQNEKFREIVSTYEKVIPQSHKHKEFRLFNETNLLTTYPGVKGVKTGFTDEAGMCLVTYLSYEGHEIIAVLLNSQNRRLEMKELLDFSLLSIGIKPPPYQPRT